MARMRAFGDVRQTAFALLLALVLACGDGPTQSLIEDNPDIRDLVSGAAADSLDSNGRFLFDSDIPPGAESEPVVTAERARELATAFTTSYGPVFRPFWEQDRGGSIDVAALTPSMRVYPAPTPFGAVPDSGCHPAYDRFFGSFYLLTMNGRTGAEVNVAISAQTTEYTVDGDGNIDEPPRSGQEFLHIGIRVDRSVAYLLSPEQAVAIAARATGATTTHVPRLMLRVSDIEPHLVMFAPNYALWRVELDRSVDVLRESGEQVSTQTLYVSPDASPRFFIARSEQPTSVTTSCIKIDENLDDQGVATITVAVRNDVPVLFESVSVRR